MLDKRNQHGSKWDDLVQFFPGKTASQVKYRFSQLRGKSNQKKGADHEADVKRTLESSGYNIVQTQMRIRLQDDRIIIVDFATLMPGHDLPENFDASSFDSILPHLIFIEAKSSDSAPFGPGQVNKLQALHDSGGIIISEPFAGQRIPPGIRCYEERFYNAANAHKEYRDILSESSSVLSCSEEEIKFVLQSYPQLQPDVISVRQPRDFRLPSDSTSQWTPLVLAVSFPLLGRNRDFHPSETCAARRTVKRRAI